MKKIKLIHEVRAVKSKDEVANIVEAQRISERVLNDTLELLKTGVNEFEVANFIKESFIKYGAPVLSFEPIVAFGKNTANIHHKPSENKLKEGDSIMLDFGSTIKHYCSDMTRTYFWGKPTRKQEAVYNAVLKAQEIVIDKITKGEKRAVVIDSSARKFLNKKFGAKKFPHGLGHGVGTVIHEWPSFKPKSEDTLPVGCVMTVEPGVYFKGWGGVRIEDMVLITKNGCKNLTIADKNLKAIILPRRDN